MKTSPRAVTQKGQALLESALVMILFFFIIMAVFDFGQFFYLNQNVTDRLRAGARYAAIHDCGPNPETCTAAVNVAIYNTPTGAGSGVPLVPHLNTSGAPGWVSAQVRTHVGGPPSYSVMGEDMHDFVTLTTHDYPVDLLLFPTFHRTSSASGVLEWFRCYAKCK